MSNRFPFTKRAISTLPIPTEGRQSYYDAGQRGLMLLASGTGLRVFYFYAKIGGRPERVKLGVFPAMSVEQARTEAARVAGLKAAGVNANDNRRRDRSAPTLRDLFNEYIALPTRGKAKRPRSPRTTADYKWQFDKHLTGWAERRISTIKRQDVESLHNALGAANGRFMANRLLALLKALFGLAVERGYVDHNPAARLRGFEEQSRERFLSPAEMAHLLEAAKADPAGDFILLALFTGARSGNVLAARWDEIDLAAGVWRVPTTKSGRAQNVILAPPAVELLRTRRESVAGVWVFPGLNGGHMTTPRAGWRRILSAAGIKDMRLHDLRRTLGSWQTILGTPLAIVGKTLGHSSPAATAVYARANDSAVRQSVETAVGAMLAAAKTS